MAESDDRTEAPTARRLQQARDSGETALSREFISLAVLGGAAVVLAYQAPGLSARFAAELAAVLASADVITPGAAVLRTLLAAAWLVGPVALVVCAMATLATFGQTRFLLNTGALSPQFKRLDPRPRLARMFGPATLMEAARAVAKLAVVGGATWMALAGLMPGAMMALWWTTPVLNQRILALTLHIAASALGAFALVAVADVIAGQIKHFRKLRMSRTEIHDEHKDTEGDPLIKRRIRQIMQQRARRRMMAAVPTATVILTNPTHYAVALAYDRANGGAPRVVAKGADEVAARIRDVANRHQVPLVANPPLARALFKVDLGAEIPAEHYRVVAEIIAYVWRLRDRVSKNGVAGNTAAETE